MFCIHVLLCDDFMYLTTNSTLLAATMSNEYKPHSYILYSSIKIYFYCPHSIYNVHFLLIISIHDINCQVMQKTSLQI